MEPSGRRRRPPRERLLPCSGRWDLFFSSRADDVDVARDLCGRCWRRDACLELALACPHAQVIGGGVWGGTTPTERRAILRSRERAAS